MKVLASITLIISIPMVIFRLLRNERGGNPLYHLLVSDCRIHTLYGGGGCHSQKETNALRLRVPVHTCLLQPAFRENAGFFSRIRGVLPAAEINESAALPAAKEAF